MYILRIQYTVSQKKYFSFEETRQLFAVLIATFSVFLSEASLSVEYLQTSQMRNVNVVRSLVYIIYVRIYGHLLTGI